MPLIEERGMLLFGGLDEGQGGCGALTFAGDGDDLEVLAVQLFSEVLPDRQVEPAASPRSPGEQEEFTASKVGEGVGLSLEIGEGEIGGLL